MATPLTEDQKRKILLYQKRGVSALHAAKLMSLSHGSILRVYRGDHPPAKPVKKVNRKLVLKMANNGIGPTAIGKELGYTNAYISRIIREERNL